ACRRPAAPEKRRAHDFRRSTPTPCSSGSGFSGSGHGRDAFRGRPIAAMAAPTRDPCGRRSPFRRRRRPGQPLTAAAARIFYAAPVIDERDGRGHVHGAGPDGERREPGMGSLRGLDFERRASPRSDTSRSWSRQWPWLLALALVAVVLLVVFRRPM